MAGMNVRIVPANTPGRLSGKITRMNASETMTDATSAPRRPITTIGTAAEANPAGVAGT